jgi:circadian clock protein KaiB
MNRPASYNERLAAVGSTEPWVLKLFVTRDSAISAGAIVQLRRIQAEYLPAKSTIEIIDIMDDPNAAEEEQILAIPTLVRKQPQPTRRVIGDLSDIPRVLVSIGFLLPDAKTTSAD